MISFVAEFQDKQINDLLDSYIKKIDSVHSIGREIIDIITIVVYADVIDHFRQQRGEKGRWKGWSKGYQKRMASLGKGTNKILQDTGHLRMSFTPRNWRKESDAIVWYHPAQTKSGFSYAYAHNEGGQKLPKRDFMWLSPKAITNIETQVIRMLEGK